MITTQRRLLKSWKNYSNVDFSKYYFRIIVVIALLRVILREITTIIIFLSGRFRSLHTLRTVGVTRYVLRLTPKNFEMNHSKFFFGDYVDYSRRRRQNYKTRRTAVCRAPPNTRVNRPCPCWRNTNLIACTLLAQIKC